MSFEGISLQQPTDSMLMNPTPPLLAFSSPMHPHNFFASPHLDYSSKALTPSPHSNISTSPDFGLPILESIDQNHTTSPALHAAGQPINHYNQHLESTTTSRDGYNRGSEFPNGKNGKDMIAAAAGSRSHQWVQPTPQYHHTLHSVANNTILESEAARRHSFDGGLSLRLNARFSSPDVKFSCDDLGPSMHGTHNSPVPLGMEPSSNSNLRPPEYYVDVKPMPSPTIGARLTWMQSGDMQENNCGNQGMLELHPQSQPNVYNSSASSLYPQQRYIPTSFVQPGIQNLRKLSIVDEPMPDHSNYDDEGGMPPLPGIQQNQPDSPEDSSLEISEPYPDIAHEDLEATTTDPDARPRRQRLRYAGDKYTPTWVRHSGQAKEGFCDTCKPGKWLQLKNSAYWYHKQFIHGISSVSGKEFVTPLDHRWLDQEVMEGLCHQCHQWVPISNTKRKNTMLWFRHAHKCHVYHKPKNVGGKKR